MTDQIDMNHVDLISHFNFLAMISLFGLSFLLFILRLSSGTKLSICLLVLSVNLEIFYVSAIRYSRESKRNTINTYNQDFNSTIKWLAPQWQKV